MWVASLSLCRSPPVRVVSRLAEAEVAEPDVGQVGEDLVCGPSYFGRRRAEKFAASLTDIFTNLADVPCRRSL